MNFATTKERILQYLDYKNISVTNFFKETGIKRGFLDSDKLNSTVTDQNITIIIAKYPDISLTWLLTGKGSMIIEKYDNEEMLNIVNELDETYNDVSEIIKIQNDLIVTLKLSNSDLRSNNILLQKLVEEKVLS